MVQGMTGMIKTLIVSMALVMTILGDTLRLKRTLVVKSTMHDGPVFTMTILTSIAIEKLTILMSESMTNNMYMCKL
jgi:hypothetical protein